MLDKTYAPEACEARIYAAWEEAGVFKCGQKPDAAPFTIVIPPPNVTGSLHMGHALNNTLQDIIIRLQRMRGKDVLWQPGTDHAGIATQMVVERMLDEEGSSRRHIGREAFVERVWRWKEDSGNTISVQLRRLGASCDWSRERFTMDDGLSRAVLKVFVELHDKGLIYKDKRLVNWDPKLGTAISDLEVEQKEIRGHLWHFRYPIEGEEGRYIVVATTRPETMLGDTAVAVHPDDERYQDLIGKTAILPLVGRRLKIVADDYADPEQGSGAVKITPAHDFNDFEVGKRHDLAMINIFDAEARLNENAPEQYQGLDRFEARKRVVMDMDMLGHLEKIDRHVHMVPYGDRGGVPIEPWLTEQWYVDAETLAKPAIAAVEEGRTRFVPANWDKTYYAWMRNIQPWCISRQLWWGHQIPAWYGPDGDIFVAETAEAAQSKADAHYGRAVELRRDEDVLDTWFSSALWPFSTLGWPEDTPELKRYYQTDLLVTGFDIIFFWVARMMMMGLHFTGKEPFHTVYIHALVRDAEGKKMSKSLGNIIDPLELIDKFGADALRFTLAALAAQGRDIKLAESRVEGYRNFATKIWNAARFAEMNGCGPAPDFNPAGSKATVNRWITSALQQAVAAVDQGLDSYKFNDAASAAYTFVWGTFCDWYIELSKPMLQSNDAELVQETKATMGWCFDQILHLLHPFMPFITEELWQRRGERVQMLARDAWPELPASLVDEDAIEEMEWVVALITAIRSVRAEMNVPAGARMPLKLTGLSSAQAAWVDTHSTVIQRLARLDGIEKLGEDVDMAVVAKGAVQTVVAGATVILPLAGVIDIDAERDRLRRELEKVSQNIQRLEAKLANKGFTENAPSHVVEGQREAKAEAEANKARLDEALARLLAA